jgi:hypothetical protein
MPAKMAGSAFLPSFGVPELRPPSAPPGGLVKKRPKRKNLLSFGVHLENPGLNHRCEPARKSISLALSTPKALNSELSLKHLRQIRAASGATVALFSCCRQIRPRRYGKRHICTR